MGNAPSISGQVSGRSHVPGDDSTAADILRERRPENLRMTDTDSEEEVDSRQSLDMEVPDPRMGYSTVVQKSYLQQ